MSVKNPVIVSGEAPETDSEDETAIPATIEKSTTVHGAVILGEDSESEQEPDVRESVEAIPAATNRDKRNYDSLLHRKLRECNLKLRWDVESYIQSNVGEATKTLQAMEQELINSQLTVQSAISSLQILNTNANKINKKVHSIVSSSFLSNVKV